MRKPLILLACLLPWLGLAHDYAVSWAQFGGGGASSLNSRYSVTGSLVQSAAGSSPAASGRYSVTGGFWTNTNLQPGTVILPPPVPGPAYYACLAGVNLFIMISDLLTNVTDAFGLPVAFAGAGANGFNLRTTSGVALLSNGTYLLYPGSRTRTVNDHFLYAVTDGFGNTNTGTVCLLPAASVPGQSNVRLNVTATNVTAAFFGVPGFQYVVQRSTNLIAGVGWVPVSTNTAPANGLIQMVDTFQGLGHAVPPLPAAVYYRLQYNP